jgi:signal transduction histidine kinase
VTEDQWMVIAIAAAWSGTVGVVGLLFGWLLRHRSLRFLPAGVALVAILAVVAGVVGTARAMFLSSHDYAVVLSVSLVAGLLALVFSMAVGHTVVRSSRSLREDARRFGESGQFVAARRGPTEFQQLSDELTRTSHRLNESRTREVMLEESRRELISWVSHDLRTPLAGLRAMTEALEDGLAEDPERYHSQMRAEVDRMVSMVDDLFELSQIHAGVLALSLQTVAVSDLVSETIASADPVARARQVRLGGAVDQGVLVRADPTQLSRVVGNLVMNAIRHTPPGGQVEILGRSLPAATELSVTDGCGGIPEPDLDRVFDVAWRGNHARTPDTESSAGLGLAIVKGIVEAHDGTVTVHNERHGCRFLVHLPARADTTVTSEIGRAS